VPVLSGVRAFNGSPFPAWFGKHPAPISDTMVLCRGRGRRLGVTAVAEPPSCVSAHSIVFRLVAREWRRSHVPPASTLTGWWRRIPAPGGKIPVRARALIV
jgi:hypothetical protein